MPFSISRQPWLSRRFGDSMSHSSSMGDQAKYAKLEEASVPADDIDATCKQIRQRRLAITAVTGWMCTILLLVVIVWTVSTDEKFHVPHVIDCDCGNSIKEAKAKGCRYDSLAVSWLPPLCRDDKVLDEFERAGPGPRGAWLYYADSEATKPMTLDAVASLAELPLQQATFFASFEWHIMHCSFYWRKEFRMRNRGLKVEGRYDRESHIVHCGKMFLQRNALDENSTKAVVGLNGNRVGAVRDGQDQLGHDLEHKHQERP